MKRAPRTERLAAPLLLACLWTSSAHAASAASAGPAFSPTRVIADIAGHRGDVSFPYDQGRDGADSTGDRSLAPYLVVVGENSAAGGTERVPLKETSADVSIAGVIARVTVHQLFENSGRTPIEAVYVFPASTRAAVHGVRMKVGARVIEARIDRKQAARDSYEAARREGKRASLLEQERPNVFTMSVANIMPGDRIAVELDYSEMLVPEDAVYELVFPTVVGPRYAGGADPAKDRWIANPHLPAGAPEPYRFDIRVHLETGIAIKELASPSHRVRVTYAAANRADVRLDQPGGGNKDFVLRYRLAGEKIEEGLLLWEGDGGGGRRESFFALMMEPPRRPTAAQIPPREYIFLLDVSGSMHGFPLDTAKALMRNLLGRLRPTDQFNVVLFSGAAHVMSPGGSVPAGRDQIASAVADIERQHGGGGTELMGGLESCYRIPRRDPRVSRTVVVVTDGYVGVEAQAFRFIRERLAEANLFAFGIGSSVNRALIEGMARAGQGEPFVVLRPEKAAEEADKLRAYIEQPVLSGVNVSFTGFDAAEVAPQKLPDLMARRPLVLFGKFHGAAQGQITVSGSSGGGRVHHTIDIHPGDVRAENGALRWLWARRWVETLEDERAMGAGEPAIAGITALGLDYSLLTAFTSFVAVDSQLANPGGQSQSVRQPLPLPEGVSNLAVAQAEAQAPTISAPASPAPAPPAGAYGVGHAGKAKAPSRMAMEKPSYGALGSGEGTARPAPEPIADRRALGKGSVAPAEVTRSRQPAADEEKPGKTRDAKDDAPAARGGTWTVTVTKVASLTDTAPLLAAIRNALGPGHGACVAAGRRGSVRLRLNLDAGGHVVEIQILDGDHVTAACLRGLIAPLVSATAARGMATGTLELTIARVP